MNNYGFIKVMTFSAAAVLFAANYAGAYVAQIGDTDYETLAEAVAAVADMDGKTATIQMIENETIDGNTGVTIPAGYNVTLDLNGKTIAGNVTASTTSFVINNCGTLTIMDSSEGGTITNSIAEGVLSGRPAAGRNYCNNVISNRGKLTLEGGTIENAISGGACYCIDNNNSGGLAEITINGGHLYNPYTYAIRLYCSSVSVDNALTVNGGIIEGFGPIWMQSSYVNSDKCTVVITGGHFKTTEKAVVNGEIAISEGDSGIDFDMGYYTDSSDNATVSITGGTFDCNFNTWVSDAASDTGNLSITDGTFNGYLYCNSTQKFITGGVYAVDVSNFDYYDDIYDYVADGFLTEKDDETDLYYVFDPDECVCVTSISKVGSAVTLTWNGSQSGKYLVQMTDSLETVNGDIQWQSASSIVTGLTVTLPNQIAPTRFYRVSIVDADIE